MISTTLTPLAISVAETGRLLGISKHTVRAYIRRKLIKAVRIGNRVLVPIAECQRIAVEGIEPVLLDVASSLDPNAGK